MDLFLKNASKDDHLANRAAPGDMDLITSPRDGALVAVAQVDGVHVCGRCLEPFVDDPRDKRRSVEWNPPQGQGTRMLLHAGCVKPAKQYRGNLLADIVQGHQARRFMTKATKFFSK